ncbi:hypothetical protein BUZ14_04265 [Staphylococcus gallinarum]|uniref:Uncharacterized protein n=1 Tax=Staphylococcus gallinarum TaxID=1293 RepID=A0A3A0VT88_STAGA|nr:hypothetical protein [Staphylococcus gallinarum]RIP35873.1 hypothetical protein BUZ14_04265 [Staphylococcus gallinarum]
MNLGKQIIDSIECFDIDNEIQSCIEYVCSSIEETEESKEFAKRNGNSILYQEMNQVWRSQYITLAILKNVKESNENMTDEIVMLSKNEQEKSVLSQSDQTEDNTHK